MGLTENDIKRVLWTFVQTFIATFVATASGWSVLPDLATAKAATVAALVAAGAAAISLLKNLILDDSSSLK